MNVLAKSRSKLPMTSFLLGVGEGGKLPLPNLRSKFSPKSFHLMVGGGGQTVQLGTCFLETVTLLCFTDTLGD